MNYKTATEESKNSMYEKPALNMVCFTTSDVVRTSLTSGGQTEDGIKTDASGSGL